MIDIKNIDICPLCGNKAEALISPLVRFRTDPETGATTTNDSLLKIRIQCCNPDCPFNIDNSTNFNELYKIFEVLNELIDKWNNFKNLKNKNET